MTHNSSIVSCMTHNSSILWNARFFFQRERPSLQKIFSILLFSLFLHPGSTNLTSVWCQPNCFCCHRAVNIKNKTMEFHEGINNSVWNKNSKKDKTRCSTWRDYLHKLSRTKRNAYEHEVTFIAKNPFLEHLVHIIISRQNTW